MGVYWFNTKSRAWFVYLYAAVFERVMSLVQYRSTGHRQQGSLLLRLGLVAGNARQQPLVHVKRHERR